MLCADALCICQSNTKERNEQVSMMRLIYSAAVMVISWVGWAQQYDVQKSMVFMLGLFSTDRASPSNNDRRRQKEIEQERRLRPRYYERILQILKEWYEDGRNRMSEETLFRSRYKRSDWNDMIRFFSVRYWKRLWIVQEVVLARHLRIQCGNCFIEWPILSKFLTCLRYTGNSDYEIPRHILDVGKTPAAKLLYFRLDAKLISGPRGFRLLDSLVNFMQSRCSDPRDKVYGLFGLSNDKHDIKPDYNLTPLELYELMVSMPRFRTDDQLVTFSQLIQRLLGGLFHPSKTMLPNMSPIREECQQGGVFYTRGVICGTITFLGDFFTNVKEARDLLVNWHSLYFHRIQLHGPGEELPNVVKDALSHVKKDVKRAVAIDSRLSYAYIGYEASSKPCWDQVILRYVNQDSLKTTRPQQAVSSNSTSPAALSNGKSDSPTFSETDRIGVCVSKSARECDDTTSGLCACLRTTRTPIRPKWMIGSRGQVGLVPGSAKEGDTICHFQGSDVAVIVRSSADGWFHSIVGGAIIMRQWDEEPVKIHERSPEIFNYSVGTRRRDFANFRENTDQMSFHFDRTCLRLLTCRPSDLGPFADEWAPLPAPVRGHYDRAGAIHSVVSRSEILKSNSLSYHPVTSNGLIPDRPCLRNGRVHWG